MIRLEQTTAGRDRGRLGSRLPDQPDVGFYGRDETLLALDRAFDHQPIVLLHGLAGAGKTTTAAEFARWYAHTGGLDDPATGRGMVLFTSFEHYLSPAQVLDQLEAPFADLLAASRRPWLTLDDAQRRQLALQLLSQVPVLWIWDNVEPIAGFPSGTRSAWSEDEQAELVGFLRALQDTKGAIQKDK